MADDFGQRIEGLHLAGDTINSADRHIALLTKDSSGNYEYLTLDANGGLIVGDGGNDLNVNITNSALSVTTNYEYAEDTAHGDGDIGAFILAVRNDAGTALSGDGDYTPLQTDSTGALRVAGSFTIGALDSKYICGTGVNLVKDTPATVVTETPASVTEYFNAVMVSGAGYCEWIVKFGATGSEAAIMHFWTTPSHPTEYVDLPDYLAVTTAQTILVTGTNREKAASPASDFTGYATLVKKS